MSFRRRYVDIDLIQNLFINDDKVIDKFIKSSDSFIFLDDVSADILDLWIDNKKEESHKKLKEYVSRISTKIS